MAKTYVSEVQMCPISKIVLHHECDKDTKDSNAFEVFLQYFYVVESTILAP